VKDCNARFVRTELRTCLVGDRSADAPAGGNLPYAREAIAEQSCTARRTQTGGYAPQEGHPERQVIELVLIPVD